jgi:hypothetical protein
MEIRTTKVRCSNLRYGMTLYKALMAVCLGSTGRCLLMTCGIRQPLWLVSVCWELKWLSRGTLRQVGLLFRSTASNSCRETSGLSKLSAGSILYSEVAERRDILLLNTWFLIRNFIKKPTEFNTVFKCKLDFELYTRQRAILDIIIISSFQILKRALTDSLERMYRL